MAIVSNVPRFGEALRKLFGAKGRFGFTVLEDVMAVYDLQTMVPEELLVRGEAQFGIFQAAAASVGNVNSFNFTNPAGSGKLIVLERYQLLGADANGGPSNNPGINILSNDACLDLRRKTSGQTLFGVTQQAGTALSRIQFQASGAVGDLQGWQVLGATISPGATYTIESVVANVSQRLSVIVRERDATTEELQVI